MGFEFLRSIGHLEVKAAADVLVSRSNTSVLSWLALPGQIGYLLELLLSISAAVMGLIGVLRCCAGSICDLGMAHVHEQCSPSNHERQVQPADGTEQDVEVTIRLEGRFLRSLHRQRCIVTIGRPWNSIHCAGQEIGYPRDVQ